MPTPDDALRTLREALRLSPDNLPLRQHLAQSLLGSGRAEDAEREFRQGLTQAPDYLPFKLGLAQAFFQQGKNSAAQVVVEELLRLPDAPGAAAAAHVLHARLLLREGDFAKASRAYRRAIDLDPAVADAALAQELGVIDAPDPRAADDEDPSGGGGRVPVPREEAGGRTPAELERPEIRFADVGGMERVKDEIRMKIIHPLTHPEMYKAYGKAVGGGILLYGPPGCGKTYLARATAGEVSATFLAIGLHDVLDMWIGSSEKNLHELFESARRNKPCVLFFDEVDALGASRTDMRQSAGRQLINAFLGEFDGVKSSNEGVLILAATNAPWHLDPAFRRPGRFDRILFVPPPDLEARAAILRLLLAGKPVESVDHEQVARKTEGFSGADLKAVADVAVEAKLREAMKKGGIAPLTTKDLLAAAKTLRPTTAEWFATARNHALYANQGGVYDDILAYLKIK